MSVCVCVCVCVCGERERERETVPQTGLLLAVNYDLANIFWMDQRNDLW